MLTERKVKQPSRKLQQKDEISSLYDSRLSLSSLRKETSLVIRSEERWFYALAKVETGI